MSHRSGFRIALFIALAAAIGVAYFQRGWLDAAAVEAWVRRAGWLGPIVFIAAYAIATVLFVPGSIITLAGGALFGPLWGMVYSLSGATLGAAAAFLAARYLAADWVSRKAGGRLKAVVSGVEAEGWRFVAFARLVPLFPFNLLNYALGLTRIPFASYTIATAVFMVPGAFAYTWLGYVGREAAAGGEGLVRNALIATSLMAALAFLPRFVRRLRAGRAEEAVPASGGGGRCPSRTECSRGADFIPGVQTQAVKADDGNRSTTRRGPAFRLIVVAASIALAAFLAWRFVRPMDIFVVSDAFARPIDTTDADIEPALLRAERCGACHPDEYREWKTSIHSQAWTDPYFQVDWVFDRRQAVCKNCHIPLDRQQEMRTVGFRDDDRLEPLLAPNPDFDQAFQGEGVTCAGCHLRGGHITGPRAISGAPHRVTPFSDPNEPCLRCHVVQGKRWDTFYRMPPCGTTAEIAKSGGDLAGASGEYAVRDAASLGCAQCHMPAVERDGGATGSHGTRRSHLWRGGHDLQMVRSALSASLNDRRDADGSHVAELVVENTGAAHFLPTGTPDRHLTVRMRALDAQGRVLRETNDTLERTILWRPFIVDLRDTRLANGMPRRYSLDLPPGARTVETQVHYHLLAESRRKRIGYAPTEPISGIVYEDRRSIAPDSGTESQRKEIVK